MKVVRFLLFIAAAAVLLLAGLAGLAFTPAVQTWVLRREIEPPPGTSMAVGRVAIGLHHVRIEQLAISDPGTTVTLPLIEADLPVLSAIGRNVQLGNLIAKGWTIDLTQAAPAPAAGPGEAGGNAAPQPGPPLASAAPAAAAAEFQGVFNRLRLPVDLAVDSVQLEGDVIFPIAGQPPGRAHVTLGGGRLGAGRDGSFTFSATAALAPTAAVNALTARGTVEAAMDTPRTFSRIAARVVAEARGAQFPQGTTLTASVTASHANAGESYTAVVEAADRKLLAVQADYPAAGPGSAAARPVKGAWMLDMTATDLAPFALGRPLPSVVAKGDGTFDADAALVKFSAGGHLAVSADRLGVVRPELGALGPVKLSADFSLVHENSLLRVDRLALEFAGARPVLVARSLQAFAVDVTSGATTAADPTKDLLSLDVQGVPLAWLQPFASGLAVTGDDLRGSFVLGLRAGGTSALRSTAPVTIGNLALAQAGRPLLAAADVSFGLSADYTSEGWQAELADGRMRSGGTTVFTLAGKAGRLSGPGQPVKATGTWVASLPALLAQPAAAGFAALAGGRLAVDFSASLGAKQEYQAKVALTGLAGDPKVTTAPLPSVRFDLRADVAGDGRVTINAPLLIERDGRKSDLTVDGTVSASGAGLAVNARLASTALALDDLQILAAPLGTAPAPALQQAAAPAAGPARDVKPFWQAVTGEIALSLKKVTFQQAFDVDAVAGTLRLEPAALRVDGLKAGFGANSGLKLDGGVTFDAKAREPYALRMDLAVTNFDAGAFFKALDPGKPPTVEGRFDIASQLNGTAPTAAALADRVQGKFQLTSKGGICRLLDADLSNKIQKTQSTVAALGGLLGAVTGKEKISDFANRTQIVSDVAKKLAEIPFDQCSATVTRGADLNITLTDLTLIAPEERLTGTGGIRYVAGTPLLAQPLDLQLQLGVRGNVAELMRRAGLLDGRQDSLGYAGFATPLHIGGTLQNPDTGDLRNALLKVASGSLLDNLLGR